MHSIIKCVIFTVDGTAQFHLCAALRFGIGFKGPSHCDNKDDIKTHWATDSILTLIILLLHWILFSPDKIFCVRTDALITWIEFQFLSSLANILFNILILSNSEFFFFCLSLVMVVPSLLAMLKTTVFHVVFCANIHLWELLLIFYCIHLSSSPLSQCLRHFLSDLVSLTVQEEPSMTHLTSLLSILTQSFRSDQCNWIIDWWQVWCKPTL